MANKPETRFTSSGELSIAYQVAGEGSVDLVFVPGFMSHVELNWDYIFYSAVLDELVTFCRLVIFDKRGNGLSDRSLGAGTLEDRMSDICAVMDAAGLERAAILGFSNGAPLATLFAATYPDRVTALVLASPGCPGAQPRDPDLEQTLALVREYWTSGLVLYTLVQHPADEAEAITQLARFERYSCSPSVAVEIIRRGAESDLTPFAPLVRAPTLVISPHDDPVVPLEHANYLAEHIPGASQIVVDGDFHASWRPADYDETLRHIKEFLTGQRGTVAPPVDRVLSTVLFTDIVKSTDRAAELGDRNWRKLLDRYDIVCRGEVARQRGALVKHTGDGVLAHFDSPGRAVACALEMRERVGALGLSTRSGVHSGEVELRGSDVGGIAVHIASRVMSAAASGEVLVSRTVKDLTVGSNLDYVDRGEHTLKGVPGSWPLFAAH